MDLDTIITELNEIVRYRSGGGLIKAAARAPKLLEQPRYQDAGDDPQALLARDVQAAIARLPTEARKHANGLLPIRYPADFIAGRLRHLGIDGYSAPARRWHRTAILGRVAYELLELYAAAPPSYRVQSIDIQVSVAPYKNQRAFARVESRRRIEFVWTVECLVSDMRSFMFSLQTPKGLKFTEFTSNTGDLICESADRVPFVDSSDTHRYLLVFTDALPTGSPITLKCSIDYVETDQAPYHFDFSPELAARSLISSFLSNGEQGKMLCECEAWSKDDFPDMLKEYKEKVSKDGWAGALGPWDEWITSRFRVPSPKLDRCYRLKWEAVA